MRLTPDTLLRWTAGLALLAASAAVWWPYPANAARLKEVASVQGVRNNQLTGYGLVVGLDGTGDQTTQTPFTTQSIAAMLCVVNGVCVVWSPVPSRPTTRP